MPTDIRTPVSDVTGVLRPEVARGVLREFEERSGRGGNYEARFRWLLPQPMRVVVDIKRRRLSCPDLLLQIGAATALRRELTAFLKSRQAAELPAHRRVDPARCAILCPVRAGRLTLALEVRDGDWEYATGKLMALVHETHVYLLRYWPEYAHQALGRSLE